MKTLTADEVKELPEWTEVYHVNQAGLRQIYYVVTSRNEKILKGLYHTRLRIKDIPGWHYEIEEREDEP